MTTGHETMAEVLAELRAARATNERLNRRTQIAEAALNAVTSEGRAGIREDKLLHEYWQRAEDARADLRKAHAALARVEALHSHAHRDVEPWAIGYRFGGDHCAHDGQHWPCDTRAAVAAANGDGDACD